MRFSSSQKIYWQKNCWVTLLIKAHLHCQLINCSNFDRLISTLPSYTQRLLVLLFGTFRVIATNSERAHTGMTSEALGVSVAPSFFQSCVSDGKTAKMEDVLRYKVSLEDTWFFNDNKGCYVTFVSVCVCQQWVTIWISYWSFISFSYSLKIVILMAIYVHTI